MARMESLAVPSPRAAGRRRALGEHLQGYLFLLPAFAILFVFHFLPVFYAFYVSLFNAGIIRDIWQPGQFVGLGNYLTLLTGPDFWPALVNTVWYTLGVVPFGIALALGIALLLHRSIWGRAGYRLAYFIPYVTSTVAAAVVFRWIFQPRFGIANRALEAVGLQPQRWIEEPRGVFELLGLGLGLTVPDWTAGPSLALVTVVLVSIWHSIGFDTVILMAGLGTISSELIEAARIDGASGWRLFRSITLPLLSPTLFFLAIISVIRSFQVFNWFYVMTAGVPIQGTKVITITLYDNAFRFFKMGLGSAIGFVLLAIILGLTLLQMYYARKRVFYGE